MELKLTAQKRQAFRRAIEEIIASDHGVSSWNELALDLLDDYATLEAQVAGLRRALEAYSAAFALPKYADYSDTDWEPATHERSEFDIRIGSGTCSKHGRWYGTCASCRYEYEAYRERKDREARLKRDDAFRAAEDIARAALASQPAPQCNHEWVCGLDEQQCREECKGKHDPNHLVCRKCKAVKYWIDRQPAPQKEGDE